MTMLRTERPPVRVLTCSDCGHDLYPLHFTLAGHPEWAHATVRCRVAVPASFGLEPQSCGCSGAAHGNV